MYIETKSGVLAKIFIISIILLCIFGLVAEIKLIKEDEDYKEHLYYDIICILFFVTVIIFFTSVMFNM